MTEEERLAAGQKVRREVLGDAHVDRSIASRDEFSGEITDYIVRQAWGSVWTRPGLDRKTRSCIVLAILIAGRHWDELRLHVVGALNNGLGPAEIKEVILHAAAYCGAPTAGHAAKVAQEVFVERGL